MCGSLDSLVVASQFSVHFHAHHQFYDFMSVYFSRLLLVTFPSLAYCTLVCVNTSMYVMFAITLLFEFVIFFRWKLDFIPILSKKPSPEMLQKVYELRYGAVYGAVYRAVCGRV